MTIKKQKTGTGPARPVATSKPISITSMQKMKAKMARKATIPIPLTEARVGLFCGWHGELTFKSKSWGEAVLEGPGLNQMHADLLDFSRLHYLDTQFDECGRASVIVSLPDFARMRGIKPSSVRLKKYMEDFVHTTIKLTSPAGEVVIFVISDYARYLNSKSSKPIPPRRGKISINTPEISEHNRKAVPRKTDGYFEIRFSAEFQKFLSNSMYCDYAPLLPDLMKLHSDILKQAARFFITHEKWNISTDNLHDAIVQVPVMPKKLSPEKLKKFKGMISSAKHRNKQALRDGAGILYDLIGVVYDAERDHWYYTQHKDVIISKSIADMQESEMLSEDEE